MIVATTAGGDELNIGGAITAVDSVMLLMIGKIHLLVDLYLVVLHITATATCYSEGKYVSFSKLLLPLDTPPLINPSKSKSHHDKTKHCVIDRVPGWKLGIGTFAPEWPLIPPWH